jgi:hypothetical protein
VTVPDVINAVRRNHALEHATVSVMLNRLSPTIRLAGRAVPNGFYIYGKIPAQVIEESAREGLTRLQRGEAGLAVTPLCGTNIAVAGLLAGALAMLSMGRQRRIDRLPNVCMSAMLGVLASQPLGRLVQQHITTRPDLQRTRIRGIRSSFGGRVHKVQTASV